MTFDCLIGSNISKWISLPWKQQFPHSILDKWKFPDFIAHLGFKEHQFKFPQKVWNNFRKRRRTEEIQEQEWYKKMVTITCEGRFDFENIHIVISTYSSEEFHRINRYTKTKQISRNNIDFPYLGGIPMETRKGGDFYLNQEATKNGRNTGTRMI
jgi:hypothetical protein